MVLRAKYPTTCAVCSRPIEPGDPIESLPSGSRGRWGHAECAPAALFAEAPAAASEPAAGPVTVGQPAAAASSADSTPASSADSTRAATPTSVWTDGACSGNPGPGGWAWATQDGRQGSGGDRHTTNQRMEIQAALEAVAALDGPLVVVSDSTYVVNCFRDGWWRGWLARNWTTSAKKPVANRDLWEPLIDAVRSRDTITFRWVKGHSGDPMNDLVDQLAVAAAAQQ